jgi:hypothetical protein
MNTCLEEETQRISRILAQASSFGLTVAAKSLGSGGFS